jgi:hypothetical protein
MRFLPFNSLGTGIVLPLATALTTAGCSGTDAAAGVAGAAVTATGILIYEKLIRSRPALSGSVAARPPAPEVSPEEAALRDRLRFTGPYRVLIDLVRYENPLNLRIARRERDGLFAEDGVLVLGLNDPFVSTDHAGISLMREADGAWGLGVGDRSTNGTEVAGFGNLRGRSANYRVTPDHSGVRVRAGFYEIEFKLSDAVPAPARTIRWTPPAAPAPARPAVSPRPAALAPAPVPAKAVPAEAVLALAIPPPAKPVLDPRQVRSWAEAAVQADKIVSVEPSAFGVSVRIRSKDPSAFATLSLGFPDGATEAAIRCVCDFLDKHCHLFRPAGAPTMNVALGWAKNVNPYGIIAVRGVDERNTVAASLGDRVSGSLTKADLLNRRGLPEVSVVFPFDPEPSKQVIRMVEQIRDAFKRIRDALGHVHAPWEVIDPVASIFDGAGS